VVLFGAFYAKDALKNPNKTTKKTKNKQEKNPKPLKKTQQR